MRANFTLKTAVLTGLFGGIFTGPSFSQVPFPCSDSVYYQVDSNKLYTYNPSGTRTLMYSLTGDLNAIGFNIKDNLLWGYDRIAEQLFSLGSDGTITRFTIPHLTPAFAHKFNVGTFDTSGYMYLYEKDATEYYTIDLNPGSPSYLKLVDPLSGHEEKITAPWSTPTAARTISDWAFNPADGLMYSLTDGIAGNPFRIMQLNPLTGTSILLPGAVTGDGIQDDGNPFQAYGSCFFDIDGNFLVFGNVNGHLFNVNIGTKIANRITVIGTPTNHNDGAFCPVASYSPLPIILLDFTADKHENSVLLKWVTTSEKNNKGFEIERSHDGSLWLPIGFVGSKSENGNSIVMSDYSFMDNAPLIGMNFYRLKQVDFDGHYVYSKVQVISIEKQSMMSLEPNPTNGIVMLSGLSKGMNRILVIDIKGQVLLYKEVKNQSECKIDLSNFTAGMYCISVRNADGSVKNHKLIKQ